MPLSDVSILVTAGSRPGYLRNCLNGIQQNLPESKTVVVNDDGDRPRTPGGFLIYPNERVIWKEMPRDTFLTKKRNMGVSLIDTKYTLLASDDFEFTLDTRIAVIRMAETLDLYNGPDVIAGTFNNRRYEGDLELVPGEYIREHKLDELTAVPFQMGPFVAKNLWRIDIAANFFLARTRLLRQIPWDETIGPIGGEHADWFLDVKAAKKIVVWTPGLNINEQPKDSNMESPMYPSMRKRVWDGHALFLKKRGVKQYIGFDGSIS